MENKQTSIEWLIECLSIELYEDQKIRFKGLFQQSISIHKQEIIDSFNSGMVNSVDWFSDGLTEEAEEYYKETYGK